MCASMSNKSVKLYAIDVGAIIRTRKVNRYITRIYVFTEAEKFFALEIALCLRQCKWMLMIVASLCANVLSYRVWDK